MLFFQCSLLCKQEAVILSFHQSPAHCFLPLPTLPPSVSTYSISKKVTCPQRQLHVPIMESKTGCYVNHFIPNAYDIVGSSREVGPATSYLFSQGTIPGIPVFLSCASPGKLSEMVNDGPRCLRYCCFHLLLPYLCSRFSTVQCLCVQKVLQAPQDLRFHTSGDMRCLTEQEVKRKGWKKVKFSCYSIGNVCCQD